MNYAFHDNQYLDLTNYILEDGILKKNRTGINTISMFGIQMRFDLSDGSIPLLTTKEMHTKSIIHELLWFLSGSTNVAYLKENGVRIWNEWADENGELGPGIYGNMWRNYPNPIGAPIDQIAVLIDTLRKDPDSRRMIVNAWHPGLISSTGLPPCHYAFQCYVANGKLSLMLNQRSCDWFLGVPFNIAQYSMLLHILAQLTGLEPGEFIWNGGDVHIYENHINQCEIQLNRTPYASPGFSINKSITDIDLLRFDDFVVIDYEHHPKLTGVVAV